MRNDRKKWWIIVCMMLTMTLTGCTEKTAEDVNSENASTAVEEAVSEENFSEKETAYEEKNGVIYVDGEELTLEKLLSLVSEAESQYRYSVVRQGTGNIYFDYVTRQRLIPSGNDLFIHAFDTISQSYYRLTVEGTSCDRPRSQDDPDLYTSLLDCMLRDDVKYYKSAYTIEIDETSIPGTVCYKLAIVRTIDEKQYYYDYFVDANTNLLAGHAMWNPNTLPEEYVIEEAQHSNEPLFTFAYEYELPTTDLLNNVYEWYGCETVEENVEEVTEEEQTYYVKLLSYGDSIVMAIKVYREHIESGLAEAKAAIEAAPCVIMETTDLEKSQAFAAALEAEGAIVDDDMLSSEITMTVGDENVEEGAAASEEISENFEGYENQITLYNELFKKRTVKMVTPVEYIGVALDIYVHGVHINDGEGYLIIGGQPSMGAPKCEDASNILEFYIEQVYERIDNVASESAFQFEVTTKEEMTFNEHSMYKYNGVIKKSVSSTKVLEYPFVAYATTAEDTSIYWLLADYSENKDQMELLEKQALTMAESYTVE